MHNMTGRAIAFSLGVIAIPNYLFPVLWMPSFLEFGHNGLYDRHVYTVSK